MLTTFLALSLLHVPLTADPVAPEPEAPRYQGQSPVIQVQGDNYVVSFEEGGTVSLAQLIEDCQRVTDLRFHYSSATATSLGSVKARLVGTKIVPKGELYSFLKVMLLVNSFVCSETGPEGMSVIQVDRIDEGDPGGLRASSVLVGADELEPYEDQHATLITTIVDMPGVDLRQLAEGMHAMTAYTNTLQMLPSVSNSSMVLTGLGSDVVALARMLQVISRSYADPRDSGSTDAGPDQGNNFVLNFPSADSPDGAGGMTMAQLVVACQAVTQLNFHYSEDTWASLEQASVPSLGTKVIAKSDFYSTFQAILATGSFVCTEVGPEGASVIHIDEVNRDTAAARGSHSVLVTPADLGAYKDRPKALITTVLSLPNSDVGQLATAMRSAISPTSILQMERAGDTSALVITGWGDKVEALARLLQDADAASLFE